MHSLVLSLPQLIDMSLVDDVEFVNLLNILCPVLLPPTHSLVLHCPCSHFPSETRDKSKNSLVPRHNRLLHRHYHLLDDPLGSPRVDLICHVGFVQEGGMHTATQKNAPEKVNAQVRKSTSMSGSQRLDQLVRTVYVNTAWSTPCYNSQRNVIKVNTVQDESTTR